MVCVCALLCACVCVCACMSACGHQIISHHTHKHRQFKVTFMLTNKDSLSFYTVFLQIFLLPPPLSLSLSLSLPLSLSLSPSPPLSPPPPSLPLSPSLPLPLSHPPLFLSPSSHCGGTRDQRIHTTVEGGVWPGCRSSG